MAAKISRDNNAANDMVQEMYIKLLDIQNKKGTIAHISYGNEPNSAWVYRVMYNAFVDSKRRKGIKTSQLNGHEAADEQHHNKEEHEKDISKLMAAIAKLNKDEATRYECQYFLYYIGSGLSLRQLAKQNNTTVPKIYNAIRNAKERLAKLMQDER